MAHTDGHRSGLHRLPTQPPPCASRAELDAVTEAAEALAASSKAQQTAINELRADFRQFRTETNDVIWGERKVGGAKGIDHRLGKLEWWNSKWIWAISIIAAATLAVFGTCAGQRLSGAKVGAVDAEGSGAVASGH